MISSQTDNLGQYLSRIGIALDVFLEGGHGDAMTRRNDWSTALDGPLPLQGIGSEGVIEELERFVIPNGARLSEPGFWGWITAGPGTVPVVASLAATVASPQRGTLTAFNHLEELSLDWLAQLCGLSSKMKGVYSSGGSVANLVALGAARQWSLEQVGIDPAADGLDSTRVALYSSSEAHHTIMRSAGVLGLGRRNVRQIPTDDHQRIDVSALERAMTADAEVGIVPIAVVATAGTTNTGTIDPLRACGELARHYGAWFHVDGAYGLPGILDELASPPPMFATGRSCIAHSHRNRRRIWRAPSATPLTCASRSIRWAFLTPTLPSSFPRPLAEWWSGAFCANSDEAA
jgi:aromatic-L-amino-acid decarboxylase